jgi:hypothetical protein
METYCAASMMSALKVNVFAGLYRGAIMKWAKILQWIWPRTVADLMSVVG